MKTSKALFMSWAACGFCAAANFQPQDLLFISTHRNPTKIVSDDKVAYVLTENGVLLYDYRQGQWLDDIAPGMGVNNIAYNPDKNQLLMAAPNSTVLEYNPVFHRVSTSSAAFQGTSAIGTGAGDLNGLLLGDDFTYIPDAAGAAVRDHYNRRAAINLATVFNYDHLWLLTAGHGAFLGSQRSKQATSVWFGLYDSSVTAVFGDGKNLWFGSPNPAGALVQAKDDLSAWHVYASQQDYAFPNGAINDLVEWRGYLWLATPQGVVRQDLSNGQFLLYDRLQGTSQIPVNRLYVHLDQLYAGTANGVAVMDDPTGQFHNSELPINVSPPGNDFCSKDSDLWAATGVGLYVLQKDKGWKSITEVTHQDAPEALGANVAAVGYGDSTLFWASPDKVYQKRRGHQTKAMFEDMPGIFRMLFNGDVMYAASPTGVRAYNLKSQLWVDFLLTDGIPGTKVQCLFVNNGLLWIGTDLGVMRINVASYLP